MPCVSASTTARWSGSSCVELGAEPLELTRAHALAELAQRGDERRDFAADAVGAVTLDLGGEDLADLADLAPAPLGRAPRVVLEVVEVEQA